MKKLGRALLTHLPSPFLCYFFREDFCWFRWHRRSSRGGFYHVVGHASRDITSSKKC